MRDLRVRYFYANGTGTAVQYIDVQDTLISIQWTEEKTQVAREFNLTLDNWNGLGKQVKQGGAILIQYRDASAAWQEWFRGTVVKASADTDSSSALNTIRCLDPMRVIGRSEGRFSFRKNLTATQSIRRLLESLKFPIGTLADTKVKLPALTYQGRFYDAIQVLLLKNLQLGGGRFVPEFAGGKFHLIAYRQPVWSWDLDDVLSRISHSVDIENVVDEVVLRGRRTVAAPSAPKPGGGNSGDKKSVRSTTARATANRDLLLKMGVIRIVDDVDEANSSKPRIRRAAQQRLAQNSKPEEILEVTLPSSCLTFRRLQPVIFDKAEPTTGVKGRFFVSSLNGTLEAQGGTMTMTLTRKADFYRPETGSLAFTNKSASSPSAGGGSDDPPVADAPENWPGNNASDQAKAKWMAAQAQEAGLPAVLPVMAALGESKLDQYAKNKTSGASGLFQIIPRHHPGVDPFNPQKALEWFISVARTPEKKRYVTSRGLTLKQILAKGESDYGNWISRDIEGSDASGSYYQGFLGQAKSLLGA